MMKKHFQNINTTFLTFLLSLVLVTLVFISTPVTTYNGGFDSDGCYYGAIAMKASFPSDIAKIEPWCYRVLTPYLASLLPFNILFNFRILAFVSNILSILVLALIFDLLSFQKPYCLFGLLMYIGSFWTLKFSFYSPAYIDYQTQFLLLCIIYFTLRRTYILLPFLFIISALQKESLAAYSIFSAISILRYYKETKKCIRTFYVLSVIIAPFVTLFIVRYIIDAKNTYSPTVMLTYISQALNPISWPMLLQAVFSGLGVIPVLLLVNYQYWVRFIKRHWEWVVYAIISVALLFGGVDKARLFLYSLPLGVILLVHTISSFERYASPIRLAVWASIVIVIHWYIGGYFSPMGSFSDYLARMVPVHSHGNYVPYLIRNLSLSLFLFILTIQFIFGEWFYRPAIGFTRRDINVASKLFIDPSH